MGFFGTSKSLYLSIVLLLSIGTAAYGQSDSLQIRYDQLINESETYQQYKVIPKRSLDQLWSVVQDTITVYQSAIKAEKSTTRELTEKLASAEASEMAAKAESEQLQDRLGTISFFGISFSHGAYHSVVWSIIALLTVAVIIVYGMSLRARVVTKSTAADFRALQNEYEQFKERARAKEVKVKRELQTAVNKLEELKRGMKK